MILWAEMDADNTGQVSRQEFEERFFEATNRVFKAVSVVHGQEKLDIDWTVEKQAKVLLNPFTSP